MNTASKHGVHIFLVWTVGRALLPPVMQMAARGIVRGCHACTSVARELAVFPGLLF
jgi:hypothetical protein